MANPFAYEEYRKDKIRQKIEESRTQRVQVKVRGPHKTSRLSDLHTLSHWYTLIMAIKIHPLLHE